MVGVSKQISWIITGDSLEMEFDFSKIVHVISTIKISLLW